MNEIKRLIVVLSVAAVLLFSLIGFVFIGNKNSKDVYETFKEKFDGEINSLIYIGRPTCGYCNLLKPSLDDMKERYNFEYTYINIDEINESTLNKILQDLQIKEVGTPYMAVVSGGRVVGVQNGYADYDETFKFLQNNNIIASEEKLLLNYISYEEYESLIKSKEKSIIVVGQSTCSYCVNAKLVLNNIAEKNDVDINYLNVSYLKEEEITKFTSSFDYFKTDTWGTPVTIIVQKGKIIDTIEGLATEEEYTNFFKKNEVL